VIFFHGFGVRKVYQVARSNALFDPVQAHYMIGFTAVGS
jgi:hypothetical protein